MYQIYRLGQKIIFVYQQKALIVFSKEFQKWVVPGGRVNHGELEMDALVREVTEELGVKLEQSSLKDIKIIHYEIPPIFDSTKYQDTRLILHYFMLEIHKPFEKIKLNSENTAYRWLNAEKLDTVEFLTEGIKDAIRIALS